MAIFVLLSRGEELPSNSNPSWSEASNGREPNRLKSGYVG